MAESGMIGSKRMEYLDYANKAYANRDFQTANSYVESFLTTIRENSNMSKDIKAEFDKIEKKKLETWADVVERTKNMNSWEQDEVRSENRIAISLESLHAKIDTCWKVAMNHGAFND